jgi:hypothetical protein
MEAANRGALESGCQRIGLNIVLPFEQAPNIFITPDLSLQFHYFTIRARLRAWRPPAPLAWAAMAIAVTGKNRSQIRSKNIIILACYFVTKYASRIV